MYKEQTPAETKSLQGMYDLSVRSHAINRKNGFWEDWDILTGNHSEHYIPPDLRNRLQLMFMNEKLMLIVSEAAEAMEGIRKNGLQPDDKLTHRPNLSVELADIIIRCIDFAEGIGLHDNDGNNEVITVVMEKINMNAKREYKHGGKKF